MRSSALLLMALAGAQAQGATLGDVASALAHREANTYNNWDSLRAIKGAQWHDKEVPGVAFAWEGKVLLDDLGPATVLVVGARQMMFEAEISIGKLLDAKSLTQKLKAQFPPNTLIESVQSTCTSKGPNRGARIYRVTLPGKQPLYLNVELLPGNRAARASTTVAVTHEKKAQWSC